MSTLLRRILYIFLIFTALPVLAAAAEKTFTVVLDPGHGGRDYGAVGDITNEKTINLKVGLEIRRLLKDREGLKIVMTRDDDRFIELQERANIANRNHGDLFVSIHVNSVAKSNKNRRNIAGASVYALGLHRTASNFEVAKRENSVMELEADYSTKYQGFDPNSTESYIMFELSQNRHLDQSFHFAQMAESRLVSRAGRRSRGVLQAGFWVLHASAMPAVLVELDFICNPTSEKFMASEKGVDKMARALAEAIVEYAGLSGPVLTIDPTPAPAPAPAPEPCPEETEPAEAMPETPADPDALTYRVQFMALDHELPASSPELRGLEKVETYLQGGLVKFTAGGDFPSEEAAEAYARRNVRKKYPQAFVIKWRNGRRIN